MPEWVQWLLQTLALPEYGLTTVFVVSLLASTIIPMGSTPAVIGVAQVNPELMWPAILVATVGGTLGGVVGWYMGATMQHVAQWYRHGKSLHVLPLDKLEQWGAKVCLLSWLPVVGDPLCIWAGWRRLPFWPCIAYMAIGKCARYALLTLGFIYLKGVWW